MQQNHKHETLYAKYIIYENKIKFERDIPNKPIVP